MQYARISFACSSIDGPSPGCLGISSIDDWLGDDDNTLPFSSTSSTIFSLVPALFTTRYDVLKIVDILLIGLPPREAMAVQDTFPTSQYCLFHQLVCAKRQKQTYVQGEQTVLGEGINELAGLECLSIYVSLHCDCQTLVASIAIETPAELRDGLVGKNQGTDEKPLP